MPKLTDTHRVILSAAAQHDGGAVLPLPAALSLKKSSAVLVLKGLIRKGLIAERPAPADAEKVERGEHGDRAGQGERHKGDGRYHRVRQQVAEHDDRVAHPQRLGGPNILEVARTQEFRAHHTDKAHPGKEQQ